VDNVQLVAVLETISGISSGRYLRTKTLNWLKFIFVSMTFYGLKVPFNTRLFSIIARQILCTFLDDIAAIIHGQKIVRKENNNFKRLVRHFFGRNEDAQNRHLDGRHDLPEVLSRKFLLKVKDN
jgi:hypothetical protein